MTNAEAIVQGLEAINDDDAAMSVADYIGCPSVYPCAYDGGNNHEPCIECKIKWLRDKWED